MSLSRIIALIFLLATLPGLGAVWAITEMAQREVSRMMYIGCRFDNTGRAYLQLRSAEVQSNTAGYATRIFPILNCRALAEGGVVKRLTPPEEAKYLDIISQGRLPVVENGKVISSEEFPS